MVLHLVALFQIGSDQAGPVQQSISPPSGGVSPLSWVIICGLATAVAALAKFCLTLYSDLKKSREELARTYEDQAQLLKVLRAGLDMPKPSTHFPPPTPPPSGNTGGTP